MNSRRLYLLLPCTLLLVSFCMGLSWGPIRTQGERVKYLEIGVTMTSPKGYQALPIPRSEALLKLSYVRREGEVQGPINWSLFRVDHLRHGAITPFAFVADVLKAKRAGEAKELADMGEYRRAQVPYEQGARRGLLFAYVGENFTYYLVGEAPAQFYDEEVRSWRKWAGALRLHPPKRDARARAVLTRRYSGSRYSDPERRIAARLSLVDGWKAHDGEHYIYLVHGLGSQDWKTFDGQLMGVRRYLTDQLLSHPNQEPKEVGVVRLCRDRTEYMDFGGMPQALGYFSPNDDELVMHNGPEPGALLSVMRHETFHQYIYSALGGIQPHIWFDEGFGELMASAEVGAQRVVGFQPMGEHQRTLAAMLADGGPGLLPLEGFLRMGREAFYENPAPHYAQAWILVEFLMRSDFGLRSSRGKDFCRRYVAGLRDGWAQRLEGASSGKPIHMGTLDEIREEALLKALHKIELDEWERAFGRFVEARVAYLPK